MHYQKNAQITLHLKGCGRSQNRWKVDQKHFFWLLWKSQIPNWKTHQPWSPAKQHAPLTMELSIRLTVYLGVGNMLIKLTPVQCKNAALIWRLLIEFPALHTGVLHVKMDSIWATNKCVGFPSSPFWIWETIICDQFQCENKPKHFGRVSKRLWGTTIGW